MPIFVRNMGYTVKIAELFDGLKCAGFLEVHLELKHPFGIFLWGDHPIILLFDILGF
jgi:hypothetical protein